MKPVPERRVHPLTVSLAVVALGLGGFAAIQRARLWALDWPWGWVVGVAALPAALAGALALGLGGRRLVKGPRLAARPWMLAAIGAAAAAWGALGATASFNPLADALLPRDDLPSEDHGAIVVFSDEAPAVADVRRGGLWRWSPAASLGDGPVRGAWWSKARGAIVVQRPAGDGVETVAIAQDGKATPLYSVPSRDACAEGCAMTADGLACARVDRGAPTGPTLTVCRHDLAPGEPKRLTWAAPLVEAGPAVVAPDAMSVLYTDRCAGEATGSRCLWRAAIDGTGRAMLGTLGGDGCRLAIAPDGARAAVATRGDPTSRECTHLFTVDLRSGTPPREVASFDAREPKSYDGVVAIAFSPDGGRLAVLTDEEEGCAGAEGVSFCHPRLTVLRADGAERRPIGGHSFFEARALVWVR